MDPIVVGLSIKAGKLIFMGFFLAIGFYAGKKLTNEIDEFLYNHSKEGKFLRDNKYPILQKA